MRLARSSLHAYRLPYARPVKWSDVVEEGGSFLLLRLDSDDGHVGVAEMTLKPTWTGFGLRSLSAAMTEVLLPRLAGADLSDAAEIAERLRPIPGQHAPKALFDNAWWDLRAAAAGQPLWIQWGGRPDVPVSYTVTRQAPEAMAREAAQVVERLGVSVLKIKGGQGAELDSQVLRVLRSAVGSHVGFYVDANGAYASNVASDYARTMFDAGALVVEDPCPLTPGGPFTALQSSVPGPVLVDFNCWGTADLRLFADAGARAFSLKPGRFGLSETRAMLDAASALRATTVVGLFGESALGTWQALALAACQPDPALPAEVTWYLEMQDQVVSDVPAIRGGRIRLPDAASVAERIDWGRIERLAIAPSVDTSHP